MTLRIACPIEIALLYAINGQTERDVIKNAAEVTLHFERHHFKGQKH
jgi:hypothetical protein